MSIKIKPSKKGTLHDAVGVSRDKKIPASKLKVHEGDSPALKKKKQFAINAKKWHHADEGVSILPLEDTNKPKKNKTIVPNNYGMYSGVVDNGKAINNPTYDQSLHTMIQYMKNNNSDQSSSPSNTYRPEFEHTSINYNPNMVQPVAKYGKKIMQDGGSLKTSYNPNLAPKDTGFQNWYNTNTLEGKNKVPFSDKLDYDYYSYYRNGDYKNYQGGHFPDTYKRPNHKTFSTESIYSVPDNPGGTWKGETYVPAKKMDIGGKVKQKNKSIQNPPITVTNPNDPKLRAYNDSLTLYNKTSWLNNLKFDGSRTIGSGQPIYGGFSNDPKLLNDPESDWNYYNHVNKNIKPIKALYEYYQNEDGTTENTTLDKRLAFYKKPVQPVVYKPEQKDYPIVTRPKAQVRGTITPSIPTGDTSQDGVPIYGPANSTIGYYNNGTFNPYTGDNQRGTVNNPDTELMKNPTELNKYLNSKGLPIKRFGGKIKRRAAYGDTLEDDQPLLKRKVLDVQPINSGSALPSTITVPDNVKGYKQDPKLQGKVQDRSKNNGNKQGYDGSASVDTGAVYMAGLGLANLLLGPDEPRRRIDNTLVYNQFPQGTGSQALAANGKSISPDKAREILHDGTVRGHKITDKQRKFFGAMSNQAAKGKVIKGTDNGLTTYDGGSAPKVSDNMFDGGTHMFQGDSHAEGGIKSSFKGTGFEAEGGEPFAQIDGKGIVFGKLKNPLTGNMYKTDMKRLMEKEQKVQGYLDKGTKLVNDNDPTDKFQLLAFNSGTAMMKGAVAKQKELAETKKHLGDLQEAHLDLLGEQSTIMANGGSNPPGKKKWKYQGTDTSKLDSKIQGFVNLIEEKGLTGYSGAHSGVDKRNTKSGRPSRHSSGQALDMMFDNPDAYQTLLKDPDIANYAMKNGLTMINEYDPNVASKTGATAGHVHIGYDRGTQVSDQFRNDARALYPNIKQGKGLAPMYTKPLSGATTGDAYTETAQYKVSDVNVTDPVAKQPTTTTQPTSEPYQFKPVAPQNIKPTKSRLEPTQILGEISALFDKPDYVAKQSYNPELYTPYQVSFQDRVNRNASTFNALQQANTTPEELSTLAGQQYEANDNVLADEFRTNQAISNDINNKNVSLINEAKLKNIDLNDLQYVRQSQAKSITKQNRQNALSSISSKLLQKEASNNTLNVYKNLFPDYDFDNTGQVNYQGGDTTERINWHGLLPGTNQSEGKTTTSYDANGNKKGSRVTTNSAQDEEKSNIQLDMLRKQYIKNQIMPLAPIQVNGNTVFQRKKKASNGTIVKMKKNFC